MKKNPFSYERSRKVIENKRGRKERFLTNRISY
jgi:hypothetical protein